MADIPTNTTDGRLRDGQEGRPIPMGVMQRVRAGVGAALDVWFGPGKPPAGQIPPGGAPRRFEYPVGFNIGQTPRSGEPISFAQLRSLANMHDVTRLGIETVKDRVCKLRSSFRPKARRGETKAQLAGRRDDPRIDELELFFENPGNAVYYPDGGGKPQIVPTNRDAWMRSLLEDLLVIDAPSVQITRNAAGKPWSLDVIDGATIKPVLDNFGRIASYQQWLYGVPDKTVGPDELVYMPANPRTNRVYGFSPVEQIIVTVNIGLRRQTMQLAHFTEGNIPEGFVRAPEKWSGKQIEEFQASFDAYMSGNVQSRSKMVWVPGGGSDPVFPKLQSLGTEMDEWIVRVIMFAFSLSPQWAIKMMNRATAESAQEEAADQGLLPLMGYLSGYINRLVYAGWGYDDLEHSWDFQKEVDVLKQAQVHDMYLRNGTLSLNEVREDLGRDATSGGDEHLIYSAVGVTTLSDALLPKPAADPALQGDQKLLGDGGASADAAKAALLADLRKAARRENERSWYGRAHRG